MNKNIKHLLTTSLALLAISFQLQAAPALAAETITLEPLPAPAFESSALSFEPIQLQAAGDHGTTLFGLPVNEGSIDRSIRAVIAAGLIGTGIYGLMNPTTIPAPVSYSLLGVSAIPVLTAATGYCPLYQLVGVDYTF